MNAKTIITVLLLLFVALSVGYLVIQNTNQKPITENESQQTISPETGKPAHRFVAYYFHGNARCVTCQTLEAYAAEAFSLAFQKEFDNGILEWQVVNTDEPENEHYINEYNLSHQMVVLVEMENGQQTNWKSLEKIWDLVNDKTAYLEYIQSETKSYLDKI